MQTASDETHDPAASPKGRVALLVVPLLVFGLAVWWPMRSNEPERPADPAQGETATEEVERSEGKEGALGDPAPQRTGVDTLQKASDAGLVDGLRVQVSVADRSVPMDSLVVRRLSLAELPQDQRAWLEDARGAIDPQRLRVLDRARYESEERFTVETDGTALLPATERYSHLLVIHSWADGRIASAQRAVSAKTREVTLQILEPEKPLKVRVLDHLGLPAAGVALRISGSPQLPTRFGDTETGVDGRAELFGWASLTSGPAPGPSSDPAGDTPVVVSVVAPLQDPRRRLVARDHDLDETIEIRLPKTCEVEIRCLGFPDGATGSAGLYPWPKMPGMFGMPERLSPLQMLQNGSAVFRWTGVDYRFIAYAFLDGVDGALERRIRSPIAPGDRLEVVFDAQKIPSFRGRLVDAEGKPPRPGTVEIGRGGPNWSQRRTATTDAFGQFHVFVSRASVPTSLEFLEFRAGGASVRIPVEELVDGPVDLGTLTLR